MTYRTPHEHRTLHAAQRHMSARRRAEWWRVTRRQMRQELRARLPRWDWAGPR